MFTEKVEQFFLGKFLQFKKNVKQSIKIRKAKMKAKDALPASCSWK